MTITKADYIAAIEARRNGEFNNRSLIKFGWLWPDTEADVTEFKRQYLVNWCGFTVGARQEGVHTDHPGAFMVVEDLDGYERPQPDGRQHWAIVGDDLSALIAEAFDVFIDEYPEEASE